MPVRPEDDDLEPGIAEVPDLGGHQGPTHVDETGGFEPDICERLLLGLQELPELVLVHKLHRIPGH